MWSVSVLSPSLLWLLPFSTYSIEKIISSRDKKLLALEKTSGEGK